MSNHTFLGIFSSIFPPLSKKEKDMSWIQKIFTSPSHGAHLIFPFHLFFVSASGKTTDSRNLLDPGGHHLWNLLDKMVRMLSLRTVTSVAGYSQPRKKRKLLILFWIWLMREGRIPSITAGFREVIITMGSACCEDILHNQVLNIINYCECYLTCLLSTLSVHTLTSSVSSPKPCDYLFSFYSMLKQFVIFLQLLKTYRLLV